MLTSLSRSSSWTLGQSSIASLGSLGVFPRTTFDQQLEPVLHPQRPRLPRHPHPLLSRTFVLLHPFLAAPQAWSRMLEAYHCSLRLAGGQGAALVTKYQTRREDIQRAGTFENYVKRHYKSWVAFARETGHGNDINPVLVTGVDMTRDFAMMSYSNDDEDLRCEFTTSALEGTSTSIWGTWHTTGPVHTNCGPQLCSSPSPKIADAVVSDASSAGIISDEYDQCVFIRYYTMRKRLGIPKVIKAGAGPHDLGPGDHQEGGSQSDAQSSSDSGSDIADSLHDDCGDNDKSSVTSVESEPDIVMHNTTAVRPSLGFSIRSD